MKKNPPSKKKPDRIMTLRESARAILNAPLELRREILIRSDPSLQKQAKELEAVK